MNSMLHSRHNLVIDLCFSEIILPNAEHLVLQNRWFCEGVV